MLLSVLFVGALRVMGKSALMNVSKFTCTHGNRYMVNTMPQFFLTFENGFETFLTSKVHACQHSVLGARQ
jgi:hypothetical protein